LEVSGLNLPPGISTKDVYVLNLSIAAEVLFESFPQVIFILLNESITGGQQDWVYGFTPSWAKTLILILIEEIRQLDPTRALPWGPLCCPL
jgi:hypothetical protein